MVENADPGKSVEFLLRSRGLEATLQAMAAEVQLPFAIDDVTTLALVEADGARLSRTYVVDVEGWFLSAEFRTGLMQGICAHEGLIALMREGATIEEVYVHVDGSEIGSQVVTRQVCGF